MKIEPAITYVSHGGSFFITIPERRNLNSYPGEILQLLGDDLREVDTRNQQQFDDNEYILQLNLRVYSTNKNKHKHKHKVQVKHTIRQDDFNAIPNEILIKLGPLTQTSYTSNISDLSCIQEILMNGYIITPPLKKEINSN